jgi:hypothetical protein
MLMTVKGQKKKKKKKKKKKPISNCNISNCILNKYKNKKEIQKRNQGKKKKNFFTTPHCRSSLFFC